MPELGPDDERGLHRRLVGRESLGDRAERPAVGSSLPERSDEIRVAKSAATVRPAPNAPLLMRLVRTPFELAPVRPVRQTVIEPAEPRVRERLGRPTDALTEARREAAAIHPIDAFPHRPEFRPHPFARARSGAEGEP